MRTNAVYGKAAFATSAENTIQTPVYPSGQAGWRQAVQSLSGNAAVPLQCAGQLLPPLLFPLVAPLLLQQLHIHISVGGHKGEGQLRAGDQLHGAGLGDHTFLRKAKLSQTPQQTSVSKSLDRTASPDYTASCKEASLAFAACAGR